MKKIKNKPQKNALGKEIKDVLTLYFKTQFILTAIVTLMSWVILHFLQVPLALFLAFTTGALSTIPLFGMLTAAILTSLVVVFDKARFLPNAPMVVEGVVVFVIYIIFNFCIDWLLTPYLTGKIVKIHPVIILISVLLGSALFGIVGAFVAVPVLLIITTMQKHQLDS